MSGNDDGCPGTRTGRAGTARESADDYDSYFEDTDETAG
jgi:hypothetical protein